MSRKHYRHDPICPACGEETATVIDGLCLDCQPADASLDGPPPEVALVIAYEMDWPV